MASARRIRKGILKAPHHGFPALSSAGKPAGIAAMAKEARPWTLEDLIDFECEIGGSHHVPADLREAVLSSSRGLDGAAARRVGFRVWLDEVRSKRVGRTFASALGMVATVLAVLMFLAGISGVLGMVDREKAGVNVTLFLAILIGGQWLLLLIAGVAWLLRRRAADGFSGVQALVGKLARRFAGEGDPSWWGRLMDGRGPARDAVLWRLARLAQGAGICFNAGILTGLAGLVLVRHVGFFWETTTRDAMQSILEKSTTYLSIPWSAWWPGAVPDATVTAASRWLPDHAMPPGPAEWWRFLLMATLVWGLLPRLLLWFLAWNAGRRALQRLDFQSRAHRALWRELTGTGRVETDDKPLDGVLVLDVGGSGLTESSLRPFLLRRMRVHVASWHPVAVMDAGAENDASKALAKAPAGVVLLAEGWALSPPRMSALHSKIRLSAGPQVPIKFLVANAGAENTPLAPTAEEHQQWERFVDSLRDPEAEVFFYQELQPAE